MLGFQHIAVEVQVVVRLALMLVVLDKVIKVNTTIVTRVTVVAVEATTVVQEVLVLMVHQQVVLVVQDI